MRDLNQEITDQIIEQIEAGTAPWRAGRSVAHTLPLRHKGESYNGVNILLLWREASRRGYVNPNWMTFSQAKEYGGQVQKGQKSSKAIFAASREKIDEKTGEITKTGGFLKQYSVFNSGQIDGLPERFYAAPPLATYEGNKRIKAIDDFLASTGINFIEGTAPCFSPSKNVVEMPPMEHYENSDCYYHDLLHEMIHWTLPEDRLNRDFGSKKFGDNGYIREELVAELGSSFLLAHFGLSVPVRNSSAYISEYLEEYVTAMRDDNKLIVSAASHASKAMNYLISLGE